MYMFPRTALSSLRKSAYRRLYSTIQPPPILLKLRSDLKDALRSKDANKLSVIRGLLTEISNASNRPVKPRTDVVILSLINKIKSKSRASISDFRAAGREDLVEKEEEQLAVLESYARMVDKLGREEIAEVVEGVIQAVRQTGEKAHFGDVMKKSFIELAGRPVVKSEVVEVAKEALRKSP